MNGNDIRIEVASEEDIEPKSKQREEEKTGKPNYSPRFRSPKINLKLMIFGQKDLRKILNFFL